MRLDEIRELIQDSTPEDWHVLPTSAPTYVHRFQYGSDARGDAIWGLDEHYARAVLVSDVDVGLVWGMTLDRDLEPDWAEPLSAVNKKVSLDLIEVLYRGQPVDRIEYAVVDNGHGHVPWPVVNYRPGANQDPNAPTEPPDSMTVTAWDMAVVSLTDVLGRGGAYGARGEYGTPESYAERAGIKVV